MANLSERVLHLVASTDRRGAELFAFALHSSLCERGEGSSIVALARGQASNRLDVSVLGRRSLGLCALARLRAEALRSSVVVAHGSRTLPACALALTGTGVPFIYRSIGDPHYWVASRLRRVRVGAFLRRAHAVVVLWPGAADELVRLHRLQHAAIHVIPNGVPATKFPVVDDVRRMKARQTFGLPANGVVALSLGALSPEKCIDLTISAVARLPGAALLVVGEGSERARLVSFAASMMPGRAVFVGSVGDPAEALSAADVLVLPSRSEGMPAVVLEAGLSGLPVVASDVGGLGEVVVDRKTGVLVPPGNVDELTAGLEYALANAKALGAAARSRCVARHDIVDIASQWDLLLAEVAKSVDR